VFQEALNASGLDADTWYHLVFVVKSNQNDMQEKKKVTKITGWSLLWEETKLSFKLNGD